MLVAAGCAVLVFFGTIFVYIYYAPILGPYGRLRVLPERWRQRFLHGR
jgi:hypothetical protein